MLQATQRLDDFEIIRPLGKGGMGEVYEAQQLNPARRVALKVLAPWLAHQEEALERFRREVEVLANLDHPGIVHVISTGKTPDGLVYYTMNLVRGTSLSGLIAIASQPPTSLSGAPTVTQLDGCEDTPGGARVAAQYVAAPAGGPPHAAIEEYRKNRFQFVTRVGISAARALAAAHQQGHLHRDIKPSNLMIDHHGQLYLVDFGLTRALDPSADVSRPGAIRGTPWYMSPEQARSEPIDQRTDIYSLGITLYELATVGTGPFTASRDDAESVLEQVRAGMHLPLRTIAPDIPRELERIILRAVQLKPKRRYQFAEELAADLEKLVPTGSGLVTPSRATSAASSRTILRPIVAGCALIVVSVLLALGIRSLRYSSPPASTSGTDVPAVKPASAPTNGYPDMLRSPPSRTAVPLLRGDFAPVWPGQRVMGDGSIRGLPTELLVHSPPQARPTMIALADSTMASPTHRWFEFTVELRQILGAPTDQGDRTFGNALGVFWGYPSADSGRHCLFFVVQLDQRPVLKDVFGRLTVGTSLVREADGIEGSVFTWLRPLPRGKSILALPGPGPQPEGWRQVRVRVVDHEMKVTVDGGPSQEFSTGWLVGADSWLKDSSLDPRGAMGIWVRDGIGSFRNASYMALPGRDER
jgi:serine/threonine protein kinase